MEIFRPDSVEQLQAWMQDTTIPSEWCVDQTMAAQLVTPRWVDLKRLNAVRWFSPADLTITVETGITMGQLRHLLVEQQLYWPFFTSPDVVLADFLAQDGPGLEAGLLGFPRDWVLGSETLTGTGVISESGGRVVKNVSGYDLSKLIIGSHHTLGVLTAVTLKVQRLGESALAGEATFDDATDAFRFVDFLLRQDDLMALCEVYQASRLNSRYRRNDHWCVLLELRGHTNVLDTLQPVINEFSTTLNWMQSGDTRNQTLYDLQHWPSPATILEWAFPPPASLLVCRDIHNKFGLLDRPVMQIRPAAGVLYTIWPGRDYPEGLHSCITAILSNMSHVGLTVQCVQASDRQLYRTYNLPADDNVYRLMSQMKQLYDPAKRLANPRLPV
jgi:FAD binding domain